MTTNPANRRTFRRLLLLALPFWRGMLLAVLLGALTIASSIGLMMTSAWLISKAGLQPSIADLSVAPPMVRFFGIARGVFRYIERLVSHEVTFRLLARVRVHFYSAIEPLAPARLSRYRSGDLLGRVVADVESLENLYIRVLSPPLVALLIGALVTLIVLGFDALVALVLLASLVAAGTGLPLLAWSLSRGPGRDVVRTRAELNAVLVDGIQGLADTVAYGREAAQLDALEAINARMDAQERRLGQLDGLQTGLMVLAMHLAALAVLIVAIPRVEPIYLATLTLGTLAAFEAIIPLAPAAHHLGLTLQAGERLLEVVDAEPAVQDPAAPAPPPTRAALRVQDLTFRYHPLDPPALDGVSFDLPPGKIVAVVGPSGAGKSTLANLLLRFWNYDGGSVQLDGRELRDYAQADVRAAIGVMTQRTHLFNTTIRENIAIARDGADEAAVMAAARRARVHDFIAGLPQGYATFAGEGGLSLSGGERQRIALARVLLKGAPLTILDEATANLDAVTERAVLESIYETLGDRSLLLITHRLTLLDRAHEIIVLEGGRVAERGTHRQLFDAGGLYARLWRSQQRLLADDSAR